MTYAIHRYPTHLIDVVRLAKGSRVTIRPTLPQDAELQREFFLCLSAKSRYYRFMTGFNELPEASASPALTTAAISPCWQKCLRMGAKP